MNATQKTCDVCAKPVDVPGEWTRWASRTTYAGGIPVTTAGHPECVEAWAKQDIERQLRAVRTSGGEHG